MTFQGKTFFDRVCSLRSLISKREFVQFGDWTPFMQDLIFSSMNIAPAMVMSGISATFKNCVRDYKKKLPECHIVITLRIAIDEPTLCTFSVRLNINFEYSQMNTYNYPPGTNKNSQVGLHYTLYHCHIEMTNSKIFTESLQPLFSCKAC